MSVVHYATEGLPDAAVAEGLIAHFGGTIGRFSDSLGGKAEIDRLIPKYADAARFGIPRLVLRDLDHDAPCAGALVARLLAERADKLCLRIAIREIESWLMADIDAFVDAIPVRRSDIPRNTDHIADPKRLILDAVRRNGGKTLQRRLLSRDAYQAFEGPEYTTFMQQFAMTHWSAGRAIGGGRSASLTRSAARIEQFIQSLR
jgi:hypothetical protein